MKKAIVFGATGQLGCYSALALKEHGYETVAVGRRISDGGFFKTRDIEFVGGVSLEDEKSFEKLPSEDFDVVVNMAGTMPAHADMNMMPYVQSIVVGTVHVCEWMKKFIAKGLFSIQHQAMWWSIGVPPTRLMMMPFALSPKTAMTMLCMQSANALPRISSNT